MLLSDDTMQRERKTTAVCGVPAGLGHFHNSLVVCRKNCLKNARNQKVQLFRSNVENMSMAFMCITAYDSSQKLVNSRLILRIVSLSRVPTQPREG